MDFRAEASTLGREFFQSILKRVVVFGDADISNHPAVDPQISARLPFANVELISRRLHGSKFQCRR
jgi:hypothetical protein